MPRARKTVVYSGQAGQPYTLGKDVKQDEALAMFHVNRLKQSPVEIQIGAAYAQGHKDGLQANEDDQADDTKDDVGGEEDGAVNIKAEHEADYQIVDELTDAAWGKLLPHVASLHGEGFRVAVSVIHKPVEIAGHMTNCYMQLVPSTEDPGDKIPTVVANLDAPSSLRLSNLAGQALAGTSQDLNWANTQTDLGNVAYDGQVSGQEVESYLKNHRSEAAKGLRIYMAHLTSVKAQTHVSGGGIERQDHTTHFKGKYGSQYHYTTNVPPTIAQVPVGSFKSFIDGVGNTLKAVGGAVVQDLPELISAGVKVATSVI